MPHWKHKIDIKRHFIQDRDPTSAEVTEIAKVLMAEIDKVVNFSVDEELKYELSQIRDELESIGPEDDADDATENFNFWLDELYNIGNYNHRIWVG